MRLEGDAALAGSEKQPAVAEPGEETAATPALTRRKLLGGKTLMAVVFVAIVLVGVWLGLRRPEEPVQSKIERGVAAQNAGNTEEAESLYKEVLRSDPENKVAYYNLGVAAQMAGRIEEAEGYYRRSLKTDPNFLPALFNLAILKERLNENEESEQLYRRIIENHPETAPAYLNLGFLLAQKLDREDEGRAMFAKALELDPALAARIPADLRPVEPQSGPAAGP